MSFAFLGTFVFQNNSHLSLSLFWNRYSIQAPWDIDDLTCHTSSPSTAWNSSSGPRKWVLPWLCNLHTPSGAPFLLCEMCCLQVAANPLSPAACLPMTVPQQFSRIGPKDHREERGERRKRNKAYGIHPELPRSSYSLRDLSLTPALSFAGLMCPSVIICLGRFSFH